MLHSLFSKFTLILPHSSGNAAPLCMLSRAVVTKNQLTSRPEALCVSAQRPKSCFKGVPSTSSRPSPSQTQSGSLSPLLRQATTWAPLLSSACPAWPLARIPLFLVSPLSNFPSTDPSTLAPWLEIPAGLTVFGVEPQLSFLLQQS